MKSKFTIYALLVVAAAVWGLIVWRLFFAGPAPPPVAAPRARPAATLPGEQEALLLDYPDPFRTAMSTPMQGLRPPPASSGGVAKPPPPEKPAAPKPKPDLRYCGRIRRGGVQSCLVEIGRQQFMLRQGESEGQYAIVRIYDDSLRIAFQGEEFTVKISD
ncbi:hypothetical protein FACS1894159_09820 [Bacteroidia bacterium]|nr:hypothetical protein FACS1894159_09820 [Bacteroidia bacterium]